MPYVLISAPVYQREWILPDWLKAIEDQNFPLRNIGFQFEAAPNDNPTMNILMDFHRRHPEVRSFDVTINHKETHTAHPEGTRTWKKERYAVMANFRNNLLARAAAKKPDRLFSLDTDILLQDPDTITRLYHITSECDAAAPLCYMTPMDIDYPNLMTWGVNGMGYRKLSSYEIHPDAPTFQVDVIMAAVMMTPKVFELSKYAYHPQGEDLGWSADCLTKGFKLFSVPSIYSVHIMTRAMLANYKQYGDMRLDTLIKKSLENIS